MKLFRNPWLWCTLIGLIVLSLIWAAYRFNWSGTGFQGKTMWDWLSLLIIPLALALVALFFNQMNTNTEQQIALDRQREDLLQAYLDRMSELLLEKGLRTSPADAEVRNIARVRTINVLIQLDARRIEYVFAFLREAGLTVERTNGAGPVISLKGANLSKVHWGKDFLDLSDINLSGANLSDANLSGVFLVGSGLSNAHLFRAKLSKSRLDGANLIESRLDDANLIKSRLDDANLSGAFLLGADLSGANLSRADLNEADLSGANLSRAFLSDANLSGATFSGTNLRGAKIDKSKLTPEQIAQAIWD